MATPTWNQITAPNFSAGNDLIAQAMAQLTKATTGFKSIADEYKDTIQKRNLGLIQEYVNSAKTPEELQSEGFQTGLAKLTGNMRGEYNTLAKAQIVDKAADTLLSRKANQVSIDTNQFSLDTGRKNQLTKEFTNKILAAPPEQRDALKQAAVDANAFDPSAYQQYVQGEGTIRNQNNVDKLFNATYAANVENANLAPVVTRHGMRIADGQLAVSQQNATANMLQAEAAAAKAEAEKKNTKNSYIATGLAAIDAAKKDVAKQVYGSGLNTDPTKSWKKWHEQATEGIGLLGGKADAAANTIVKLIDSHPVLSKLPDNLKILHAENALREGRDSEWFTNPIGFTSKSEDDVYKKALEKSYKDFNQQASIVEDNATIPIYRKMVFEHAQKTNAPSGYAAAKDLGLDELTIYKADIPSQLAAQAKLKYASSDKSIPENQFIENEINIATNPDYATSNKPLFPDQPKADYSNVYRPSPGRGAGGIKRKATEIVPSVQNSTPTSIDLAAQEQRLQDQAQTGNPLQQTALPPNVNKLISTPLDILTNPSTIKTKPVADPLRQAALEQTPVATNNTSQPRQLPPAEKQQEEHKTQAALSRLIGTKLEEKQALVRNAFPNASLTPINKATEPLSNNSIPLIQSMFKLPVITNTPEETKPRELTPAEKQQAERMIQADMVRLAGTKLKEKQAEVQKQFPTTPLKELAKAATPVPSPLIPAESQNAFRVKENNLALDFRTGKGTPTKEPVPMPKVTWKEPVQAVTINPIYAQLPQHKVVATFVPDGDTINATSEAYKTKGERAKKAGGIICRIDSIETPETAKPQYGKKGQPYGAEAAKILQQMVLNKEISIRVTKPTDGESNYGRDVCQIEVAGKDVSVELLREGAAWLYKEYNHYGQGGLDLEATARESKSGLWGLGNPVYPPDFRHNGYQNP